MLRSRFPARRESRRPTEVQLRVPRIILELRTTQACRLGFAPLSAPLRRIRYRVSAPEDSASRPLVASRKVQCLWKSLETWKRE